MDPKTPVVLLHAFPLNADMWESQRKALGSRKTLAPNFPGFGGRAVSEAELDRFARVVIEDMDASGIGRAVVVGLSMGGYAAFRLHALAPERLAAVVLADTKASGDDETGRARRTDQANRARQEGVAWLAEALLPALLGETTLKERPEVVAAVRAMMDEADAEGVARALEAMRERPDSTPHLADIQVPVLLMVGEEDTLTPVDEARKIAERVKDGRLTVIPGAGHLSNLEAPDRFNEALLSFLG
ncbi:MAG: alpha/beta hydrolase [Gemmatimonadota bacterium]|nr:MAG: alpha/beta hydrolase [Gemmatimonadota bacterium]